MLRPCLGFPGDPPCPSYGDNVGRCPEHQRRWKKLRNDDRKTAKAIVTASPVCVDCGSTEDLTAEHVIRLIESGTGEGPREVLCRSCNSKRNRGR